MNTMYKCILVPVDWGHEHSWQSLLSASIDLARRHHAQLMVAFIDPNSDTPTLANFLPKGTSHLLEERPNPFIAEHISKNIRVPFQAEQGQIYSEILYIASVLNIGLIFMALHTPNLANQLIGANAKKVVRHPQYSGMVCKKWRVKHYE
ncbi:Universal stress protein F [Marinomonas spartinae]|uniref:Universal stress protein F n=1 Tax=Marinomonas spartinae TaxID=1792290 RepID=A0A1A8T9R5_9GAMM|nr:universal stress protein [Marinomonas spartinae]SBS29225.1 Universal stress protein F [Marinomonas spartinae]